MRSLDASLTRRQWFESVRRELGVSVNAWAAKAGIREGTLRAYLNGVTRSLREDTAQKLIEAARTIAEEKSISIAPLDSFENEPIIKRVWVRGVIAAGAIVQVLDNSEDTGLYQVELPAWIPAQANYEAYELRGFTLPPGQEGWLVYCEPVPLKQIRSAIGHACVITMRDGKTVFRTLREGYAPGRYNLESWSGLPLISDAEITAIRKFAGLAPPVSHVAGSPA